MFEKFTREARHVVIDAQEHAREADAPEIGTEHLLFGLLRESRGGVVATFLADRLPDRQYLRAEFDQVRRRGDVTDADADALAELGIDIDQVVRAIEQAHGQDALAREPVPEATSARRRRWRKQQVRHIPFSAAAKDALQRCLGEAMELGADHIGTEHLLLSLLAGRGTVADVLATHDIQATELRALLSRRRAS